MEYRITPPEIEYFSVIVDIVDTDAWPSTGLVLIDRRQPIPNDTKNKLLTSDNGCDHPFTKKGRLVVSWNRKTTLFTKSKVVRSNQNLLCPSTPDLYKVAKR